MRCAGGGVAGAGARDDGTAPSHSSALPSPGARPCAALRGALARLAPGLGLPGGGAGGVLGGDDEIGPAGCLVAAVVAALGAGGVVVDVADRLEVTGAAVGAALDRAVGREDAAH